MDFSGALNWGEVVAHIVITNVVIEDGEITEGVVDFIVNGTDTEYPLGIMYKEVMI